jgi:ketosteroid isomerase-like protein
MRLRGSVVAVLGLLFVGASVVIGQSPRSADEERIMAADAAWLKAYGTRDVAQAVAFCDDAASMMAPYAPIATGKDAIRKLIAAEFTVPDMKLSWHADKAGVARSGELGYTSGTYEVSFSEAPGKPGVDRGKYLTVWKKQADGAWKVLFDIYNSDLPPPLSGG